jgi:hypothetical protein
VPARLAVDATCGAGSATTELEPISLTMPGRSPRPSRDAAMGSMIRSSDSPATTPTFTCPNRRRIAVALEEIWNRNRRRTVYSHGYTNGWRNLMCTPLSSAHPQARLATSRLVTHVKCVVALGAVLAVSACDGMEVGSVPHCNVLQSSCSDFGEGPAAPATAASSSPKTLAHSHSPNITSQ